MARPETAQDVVELIRRGRLVAEPQLERLLPELPLAGGAEAVLAVFVEVGLLTHYQSDELAAGRWRGLWLGGYRVLDRLGKGGMSHVFLAEHAVLGKRVAVKVLSAGLRADSSARERFVREALCRGRRRFHQHRPRLRCGHGPRPAVPRHGVCGRGEPPGRRRARTARSAARRPRWSASRSRAVSRPPPPPGSFIAISSPPTSSSIATGA